MDGFEPSRMDLSNNFKSNEFECEWSNGFECWQINLHSRMDLNGFE